MATSATGVLTPADLNDTDDAVLDVLRGGRVTPQYAAEKLDISRTYASERLKRLVEHGHVEKVAPGLYELVDDPRDGDEQDDDVDDRDQELERLRERVDALREQLEAARTGQTDIDVDDLADARVFLDRALTDLPDDVPGRSAAEDARRILEEVLEDE